MRGIGPTWAAEERGFGLNGKGKRGGGPAGFGIFGLGFGFEFGFWVFKSLSISFPFLSTQNYLNSNEFEFKLLYKQTKQNHAPA